MTDFGKKGRYDSATAREAAIQQVSKIDNDWDGIRDALKSGRITSEQVRNGLLEVSTAVPKGRDVALGADSGFSTEEWNNDKQLDYFKGRNAGHRLAFDKTTRWEDMRRVEHLESRAAQADAAGDTQLAKDLRDQATIHRQDITNSYSELMDSPQDWAKIDATTKAALYNPKTGEYGRWTTKVKDAQGIERTIQHDMRLTQAQIDVIKSKIDPSTGGVIPPQNRQSTPPPNP